MSEMEMLKELRPIAAIVAGQGQALFGDMVLEADRQGLLSDEHFTVDGTLIETAASLKSFKPRDGDPPRATPRFTSMGNGAAMPPIKALRTRRPGCCARVRARRPGWCSWPTS